jgi:formylglycine-generating enzyme required for sulfatase activity
LCIFASDIRGTDSDRSRGRDCIVRTNALTESYDTVNGGTLGLYDMSGSVYEWCFESDERRADARRVYRGGAGHRRDGSSESEFFITMVRPRPSRAIRSFFGS